MKYVPDKKISLADALSRLLSDDETSKAERIGFFQTEIFFADGCFADETAIKLNISGRLQMNTERCLETMLSS